MDGEVLGDWVVDIGGEPHDKIVWLWFLGLEDGIQYLCIQFPALFGARMGGDCVFSSRLSFLR